MAHVDKVLKIAFVKRFFQFYTMILTIFLITINFTSFICIVSAGQYSGPDYYVNDGSGSDTNNGSLNHPFKTIQKACDVATNGDTVYIMAGMYLPSIGQIIIKNKNAANEWLTIRNYQNDHVVIDGTNCPTTNYINATVEVKNSKYLRISGLTVNHSAKGGITLRTTPCSFIKIDNCTISNSSSFACKVCNGMNNITFEYNLVYNNFNNWSHTFLSQETISFEHVTTFSINHIVYKENHAGSIDMKGGCSRGVVCYNEINTTGGYVFKGSPGYGGVGVMLDARGVSHNISIYNNKIFGNVSGITLNTETTGHYEYIYVYNNLVNISATGGAPTANARNTMMISNTGTSTDLFHHIYIYSNTFIVGQNSTGSGLKVGHYTLNQLNSGNLQDVYMVNNIYYSYATAANYAFWEINKISFQDGVFIVNNNSFYRPSGSIKIYWNGSLYSSSSNPEKFGNNPLFTNQDFVDTTNGDFHLDSSSPCIDAGNDTLVPSFDFDDATRPQGEGYDIGAFEFLSGYDSVPPQISGITNVTSTPLDTNPTYGWVNVSCTVTDNVAVSQVVLRIHEPNGSWNNVSMITRTAGKYYYRTTTAFSTVGNYTYSIHAVDTSNNPAVSSNRLFSMPPNWDVNNDGSCNILDLVQISNQYGITGNQGWIREDVDNNGQVTVLDINLVSNHFGEHWYN
jgi:hypothetical protein